MSRKEKLFILYNFKIALTEIKKYYENIEYEKKLDQKVLALKRKYYGKNLKVG